MASELGRRGGKVKSLESASDATAYVEHPLKSVDDVTKLEVPNRWVYKELAP